MNTNNNPPTHRGRACQAAPVEPNLQTPKANRCQTPSVKPNIQTPKENKEDKEANIQTSNFRTPNIPTSKLLQTSKTRAMRYPNLTPKHPNIPTPKLLQTTKHPSFPLPSSKHSGPLGASRHLGISRHRTFGFGVSGN